MTPMEAYHLLAAASHVETRDRSTALRPNPTPAPQLTRAPLPACDLGCSQGHSCFALRSREVHW